MKLINWKRRKAHNGGRDAMASTRMPPSTHTHTLTHRTDDAHGLALDTTTEIRGSWLRPRDYLFRNVENECNNDKKFNEVEGSTHWAEFVKKSRTGGRVTLLDCGWNWRGIMGAMNIDGDWSKIICTSVRWNQGTEQCTTHLPRGITDHQ